MNWYHVALGAGAIVFAFYLVVILFARASAKSACPWCANPAHKCKCHENEYT